MVYLLLLFMSVQVCLLNNKTHEPPLLLSYEGGHVDDIIIFINPKSCLCYIFLKFYERPYHWKRYLNETIKLQDCCGMLIVR
jgi:hypothetical protein